MPKKKKTTAHRARSTRSSYSGGIDDHSFLIIAGGGLVVLLIVGFMFFSGRNKTTTVPSETTANQTQNTVVIKDFAFTPESTTVKVGTTVTWENSDSVEHSVVADDGTFETKVLAPGEKGSFTFSEAGSYTYHCGVHPSMTGTIVVE